MKYEVIMNLPILKDEVPELRSANGWERRDTDYPILFDLCNFWAGVRDKNNKLIAFGYVTGMGLQHGYMEDIIVHPEYQKQGLGVAIVKELLAESERYGLEIVTLTYDNKHTKFYQEGGFTPCSGGVWRKSN